MSSHEAFRVWSQTSLSRLRVTSDVELYGPDRALRSRFALNLPEYIYSAAAQTWSGTADCRWDLFGEVKRFGAEDRNLLHAERALCDGVGHHAGRGRRSCRAGLSRAAVRLVGQSVLGRPRPAGRRRRRITHRRPAGRRLRLEPAADVRVRPRRLADHARSCPIGSTRSRDAVLGDAAGRRPLVSRVFLAAIAAASTRSAIRRPPCFEHATRLAEAAALVAVHLPALSDRRRPSTRRSRQRHDAPLRVLLHEIRTSFYRKLFLFFVLAAVGPVLLFALAFGAYMTTKFRADVESEAASVVTVARRVLEELAVAEQRPSQALTAPTDDVMVWIRQVVDQDVNLFDGPRTGRDEPARPVRLGPAADAHAGRGLPRDRAEPAADVRRPTDRLGTFRVPRRGRARAGARRATPCSACRWRSRQREIEREIDELNRGVLVGAVVRRALRRGTGRVGRRPRVRSGRAPDARHAADRRRPARRARRRRHGRRTRPPRRRLQHDDRDARRAARRAGAHAISSKPGPRWRGRSRTRSRTRSRRFSWRPSTCSACTRTADGRSAPSSISA